MHHVRIYHYITNKRIKMEVMTFKVVKEFSRTPSARVAKEGRFPGTDLRRIITPLIRQALREKKSFLIDLDGASGYGTSFLEEVFGGLIREEHFKYKELKGCLKIKSEEEPELEDEIWEYIIDASNENNN